MHKSFLHAFHCIINLQITINHRSDVNSNGDVWFLRNQSLKKEWYKNVKSLEFWVEFFFFFFGHSRRVLAITIRLQLQPKK